MCVCGGGGGVGEGGGQCFSAINTKEGNFCDYMTVCFPGQQSPLKLGSTFKEKNLHILVPTDKRTKSKTG